MKQSPPSRRRYRHCHVDLLDVFNQGPYVEEPEFISRCYGELKFIRCVTLRDEDNTTLFARVPHVSQ